MANQEHLDLLKQGVAQWNEWREQHKEIRPDLSDVSLSGANLYRVNLSRADLRKADLRRTELTFAELSSADLTKAKLAGAYLTGAVLRETNFREAELREVNLIGANLMLANLAFADLTLANLMLANLTGAALRGAKVMNTIFANLNLDETKGLAEIQHMGPSVVQLHTVQLPQDGSALHFLHGVGISEEWINFWRIHMRHPIQYHSLFISYSSKDDALARRLHADLQDHGVRCWFAPEDLKIGDKFRPRIDEAIQKQDKLLLLLSEDALASNWVEDEVEAAIEKERRQQREVLFPVRLDESAMQTTQAWAAKLRRTRHIGDFTRWTDPQAYQQAFERLLRDLKQS